MALADIDTIVVVMLENRSFDHTVGYLSLPSTPSPLAVEGLRDDPAWVAAHANVGDGKSYAVHRLGPEIQRIADPAHDHNAIAMQIGGAARPMNGFVTSYLRSSGAPPDPGAVMGYYDQAAVPVFDFFARNFAICDHWFAAVPSGTQPNRLMAMSGETSLVDDARVLMPDQSLVYDWLAGHGVPWCAYQYGDFFPFFSLMPRWLPEIATSLALSALGGRGRFRRFSHFADHWAGSAAMPQVIFIEPEYTNGPHHDPNDDHPATGIAKGQAFLAEIYAALTANPARWQQTLVIVTYDEHGGFYDHVPPLPVTTNANGFPFATTGVRVPAFVVSPQVVPGTVFRGNLDHTAILQLLADRFNPGQDYSAAVGARQPHLARLAALLTPAPRPPRAPTLPAETTASLGAAAANAPVSPSSGAALSDPTSAQAFHNVALKLAREHRDLLAAPDWAGVAGYLKRLG